MAKPVVFIDGREGTTGLEIFQRLENREDIELIRISEDKRKDEKERGKYINASDLTFLCLPDQAAKEAVGLLRNEKTRIIDASSAHRTAPGWCYGFPELSESHWQAVARSRLVANPGCHASGFIAIVYPLIASGLLSPSSFLTCFSLTGYSGGGRRMIAQYEEEDRPSLLSTPSPYALSGEHKHIPEMLSVTGLERRPAFIPIVDDYYRGMATTVTFTRDMGRGRRLTPMAVLEALSANYSGSRLLKVRQSLDSGKLYAGELSGSSAMELVVAGNEDAFSVTAVFDNLGKGASGSAVENMNIMLGFEETTGLL